MSQYHYPGSTSLPTSQSQQLTSISNITTHPYQQDSPGPSQILPPIHAANGLGPYAPAGYRNESNATQNPRVSQTPDTPGSASHSRFPHVSHQPHLNPAEPQGTYGPIGPSFPQALNGSYGSSAPAQPSSTQSAISSHPHTPLPHISPAIIGLPDQYNGMSRYSGQSHISSPTQVSRPGEPRMMPVVGSQGRRGILPSAPGRPPPPGSALDGSARNGMTPHKNSENKYPCHYCNKTYLHLKHLKRHHLRHTGERPYQCCLCQETFCRSDILKRHFNKCSIRRGNPTGATHLTHAQAHLRQSQSAPNSATGTAPPAAFSDLSPSMNGNSSQAQNFRGMWQPSTAGWPSMSGEQPQSAHTQPVDSTRTSRSSSFTGRPGSSSDDDKKRFSGSSGYGQVNGSIGTSPNIGGPHDRSSSFSFGQDRMNGVHPRDNQHSSFYGSTAGMQMSLPDQVDNQQAYSFYRSGFPQYPATANGHMHHDSWANAFQPSGHDSMMYSGH